MLSVSTDNTLWLWDVASGETVHVFEGHTAEVNGCAFSPDGRHTLNALDVCTLRLWNVDSGREFARWTTDATLLGCALGPDGETVIAGDNIGRLHFLSIIT